MSEIKKNPPRSDDHIFSKKTAKSNKFWSLGLGIFDEFSVSLSKF